MNNSGNIKIKSTQVARQDDNFRKGANWMLGMVEEVLSNITLTVENNGIVYDTKLDNAFIHKIIDKLKLKNENTLSK